MKKLFTILVFTIASLLSWQAHAELKAGDAAPDFTLTDQNNQAVTLSELKGKWIVLYFYPKNNTPGCTTEACSFRDNINKLIEQQATILGISIDTVESHQEFAKKHRLPFQLLADPGAIAAARYDAMLNLGIVRLAKRHSFIINPKGIITHTYRNVDPDTHVLDVLNDLKKAQSNWKSDHS